MDRRITVRLFTVNAAAVLIALALLIAAGCGNGESGGISPDQHSQIQRGMTLDQVEAITGSPSRSHKSGSTQNPNITWYFNKTEGEGLVRVAFVAGKVDNISPYDQSVEPEE